MAPNVQDFAREAKALITAHVSIKDKRSDEAKELVRRLFALCKDNIHIVLSRQDFRQVMILKAQECLDVGPAFCPKCVELASELIILLS